jgi:hypothetical protein
MFSVVDPVFVTVNVCVRDVPVPTLPNVPVAPATATVVALVGSAGAVPLALVKPVHPTCVRLTSSATANAMKIKGLWRFDGIRSSREFSAWMA